MRCCSLGHSGTLGAAGGRFCTTSCRRQGRARTETAGIAFRSCPDVSAHVRAGVRPDVKRVLQRQNRPVLASDTQDPGSADSKQLLDSRVGCVHEAHNAIMR